MWDDDANLVEARRGYGGYMGGWRAYLQDLHRPRFLQRHGNQCVACGDKQRLELAHVTAVHLFLERFGQRWLALEASYWTDNLTILCRRCHNAYDLSGDPFVTDVVSRIVKRRGWANVDDLIARKGDTFHPLLLNPIATGQIHNRY